jgi:urease accessory protein
MCQFFIEWSNMLTLTQRNASNPDIAVNLTLALTAEERTRTRHRFETELETEDGIVFLRLPRGSLLRDGDILVDESSGSLVRIVAKAEPVLTVFDSDHQNLLKAAYHLGNRHVPVEITSSYLRLSPDPVLKAMLLQLGLDIKEEISPFYPEPGAYGNIHAH